MVKRENKLAFLRGGVYLNRFVRQATFYLLILLVVIVIVQYFSKPPEQARDLSFREFITLLEDEIGRASCRERV